MLPKPQECQGCPLYSAHGFVPFERNTEVLLLGEAAGLTEEYEGKPFVGAAGEQLRRTFERLGVRREDFSFLNVLSCRPPDNELEGAPYEEAAIRHCGVHFEHAIDQIAPKVIIPLGGVALKRTLGLEGILDRRAPKRGYVYEWRGIPCVPTLHPAFVLRGKQNYAPVLLYDIKRGREAASGWAPYRPRYAHHAGEEEVRSFLCNKPPDAWMIADIETPESGEESEDEYENLVSSEITRVSFAYQDAYAISVEWLPENLPLIQMLLLSAPVLCFWNVPFDRPRLRDAGMRLPEKCLDSMMLWHWLQSDLPKALGFVAPFFTRLPEWKSKSKEDPGLYSAADSDATQQITAGCVKLLKAEGRMDAFWRHHFEVQVVLDEMGGSGVLLDRTAQQEFSTTLAAEEQGVDAKIQELVPERLKPRKRLKQLRVQVTCPKCEGEGCKKCKDGFKGKLVKAATSELEELDGYRKVGESWEKALPFLAMSSKQVGAYLAWRGYRASSSAKEELKALLLKHPQDEALRHFVELRELHKMRSQYVDGMVPGEDSHIRTQFTRNPSTWRTASQKYNIQNLPRRYALAKGYRRMFIPAPGHALAELDFRSIEALLAGYFAGDADFMKAAEYGLHAILASHVLKSPIRLDWDHDKILHLVSGVKKQHQALYDKCKVVAYLSLYLGTPAKMVYEYPETFESTKEAKELQSVLFGELGVGLKRWQRATLEQAHTRHFLLTPFLYKHYFYDVLTARGGLGSQAKDALAFLPQATAAGIICEALLRIAQYPFLRKLLRWIIHDSLLLELLNDRFLKERLGLVRGEMMRPIPELGGLRVGVEVKVSSRSWEDCEELWLE